MIYLHSCYSGSYQIYAELIEETRRKSIIKLCSAPSELNMFCRLIPPVLPGVINIRLFQSQLFVLSRLLSKNIAISYEGGRRQINQINQCIWLFYLYDIFSAIKVAEGKQTKSINVSGYFMYMTYFQPRRWLEANKPNQSMFPVILCI
ncbi:MAG: hypothetical protein ABSA76_05580 [Bacteroidales bacterium]